MVNSLCHYWLIDIWDKVRLTLFTFSNNGRGYNCDCGTKHLMQKLGQHILCYGSKFQRYEQVS